MKDESYPCDPAYRARDNKIYACDRKSALERMGKVWDKMGKHYLMEDVFPVTKYIKPMMAKHDFYRLPWEST